MTQKLCRKGHFFQLLKPGIFAVQGKTYSMWSDKQEQVIKNYLELNELKWSPSIVTPCIEKQVMHSSISKKLPLPSAACIAGSQLVMKYSCSRTTSEEFGQARMELY